jgi:hypothetical protein
MPDFLPSASSTPPASSAHLPWLEIDLPGGTRTFALRERTVQVARGKTTVTGIIELRAATVAGLQAEVVACLAALDGRGNPVRLTLRDPADPTGDRIVELTQVQVGTGGAAYPKLEAELDDDHVTGLIRLVSFTSRSHPDSPGGGADTPDAAEVEQWEERIATAADGRVTAVRSGDFSGDDAQSRFEDALDDFDDQYPTATHVRTQAVSRQEDGLGVSFELEARELSTALPHATSVDGEVTTSTDTDHQAGTVTVSIEAELLIDGDPAAALAAVRQQALDAASTDGRLVAETVSTTAHDGVRLRASFRVLRPGVSGDVIDWEQALDDSAAQAATYEERTYEGASPVLVRRPTGVRRVTQSGSATGLTAYPAAPAAVVGDRLAPDRVRRERIGAGSAPSYRTSWTYELAVADTFDVATAAAGLGVSGQGGGS